MTATSAGAPSSVSPEIRLLLLCSRTRVSDEQRREIHQLLTNGIDWTRLVRSALHHHVTPLVAHTLATACPEAVPPDLLDAFATHARQVAVENERLTDELVALVRALDARGVAAVPFKGPTLAEQVYGDLGLRTFRDLDFLIRPEQLPATLDVLRAHDYDVDAPFTPVQLRAMRRAWGQDAFVCRTRRVVVEPHWTLVPDKMALRIDYDGLRARCRPTSLKELSVRTLAPEDLAMVLAIHGAKELWWRLNWVCDVAELLAGAAGVDWEMTLERARRQGARRMLVLALTLAHDLFGVQVPAGAADEARRDPVVARLADEARDRLLHGTIGEAPSFNNLSAFRRRAHDGVRAQTSYVLRTLFKPSPMHYGMVALPPPLSVGYYAVRAAHDYVLQPAWRLSSRRPRIGGPTEPSTAP